MYRTIDKMCDFKKILFGMDREDVLTVALWLWKHHILYNFLSFPKSPAQTFVLSVGCFELSMVSLNENAGISVVLTEQQW